MRKIININDDWLFTKLGETANISLPHTWNGIDGQDGGNDYYRGVCIYEKKIKYSDFPESDEVYIEFDGVNSSAKVYFNDELVCTHHGGYSSFRARLDDIKEENIIKVEVDNSPNDFVYPQQADFTFYGGIYRDVKLIGLNKIHFDYNFGDCFKVTPIVKGDKAEITFDTKTTDGAVVEYEIVDNGNVIYSGMNDKFILENPHLWNGVNDPYLYTANVYLKVNEKVVDNLTARFGIRSFKIDANKGFILNGREYPLRGVSRHQDRPNIGNALLYEHHKEDIDLICEMGANTVRLAHYQHSQDFYNLCDEKGLIVWAEIPFISKFMPNGIENTYTQMEELVTQNYNHPCIVVWGLSNEITMGGKVSDELLDNHKKLNDLCHSLDKTRPTTLAALTMCDIDNPYVHIPDVVSYNHYFGWYGGEVHQNGPWFDNFHKKYPNTPIGISEYGCEALDWHATDIQQGDYTEEYQAYYHEEMIKQIILRPYLWATHVWNMFDFAADARAEGGENGMNHKGLVTFDRKYKKDSFYAYKAWLSDKPMLHICSKKYVDRVEDKTIIKVYTNLDEVELFANGKSVGKKSKGKYPFYSFEVENIGETEIIAKAGDLTDTAHIRKVDTMNMDYVMKEQGAVINWFEIDTPAGFFSVNDTIGDILSKPKGKLFAIKMLFKAKKLLSGDKKEKDADVMGFSFDMSMIKNAKGYLDMLKGFTVKRGISMLGGKFTKEQILYINKELNKIKK